MFGLRIEMYDYASPSIHQGIVLPACGSIVQLGACEDAYFFSGNSETFTYDDVLRYEFAASLIAAASSFL